MTLLVHPLYNFLKYATKAHGFHTGWYMDLHENDVAIVDFDISVLPDDTYRSALDQLRESKSLINFKIGNRDVTVRPQEEGLIERILSTDSVETRKSLIRDFIMKNMNCEYGHNDYVVVTGSGGLHFYYKYRNSLYNQRNIKCIQTLFYEVDVLLGGPMHSFAVCPRTVAVKNGILGEYRSYCENFNEAFPAPYVEGMKVSDNIKRDSFKTYDDVPEEEMLRSYMHFNWIIRNVVYKKRVYSCCNASDAIVKLPSEMNPLPEEILEFCSLAKKEVIKDWEFMVSKPQKTPDAVKMHNKRMFAKFIKGLMERGVKIHCTAHPGSPYTTELTLLHLLGSFSRFNDDMRTEFFKILADNPRVLTPNAYKNLRKPHKGVREYTDYTLSNIVNYYTDANAHFFF